MLRERITLMDSIYKYLEFIVVVLVQRPAMAAPQNRRGAAGPPGDIAM